MKNGWKISAGVLVALLALAPCGASLAGPDSASAGSSGSSFDWAAYQSAWGKAEAATKAKRWREAAAEWGRVVQANPHVAGFWSRLAEARNRSGDLRGAIPAYEKAMELGAGEVWYAGVGFPWESAYNIGCCYARLGEKGQALRWLERSLEMGYRDLEAAGKDKDLASLHQDPRFRDLFGLSDVRSMSREEGWRYDLRLLVREAERRHFRPFRAVSREKFEAEALCLQADVPRLNDDQVIVGVMKLVRLLGDGHTLVRPAYLETATRRAVPVTFYLLPEGVFITSTSPQHKDLLGCEVLRFGDHATDKVLEALDAVISRDNAMGPKATAPLLLRTPRVLYGLGLIADPERLKLTVRDAAGAAKTADLPAEGGNPTDLWPTVPKSAAGSPPLYVKDMDTSYWFEYLPAQRIVYCQYNLVYSEPKNPFGPFCERLFRFIAEHDVDKLVIDLRWNNGGNLTVNRPLVEGLIRCDKINRRGKLFVIIGRKTFSAAINAAADIERRTQAIFVGEPSGSSPNFIGESAWLRLPYSHLRVSLSDIYWQNSLGMDYRTWIAPQLYAPPTFASYRSNRDPAMEAILAYRGTMPE
jgi:tetratricopeptide (TPR) repeat protein